MQQQIGVCSLCDRHRELYTAPGDCLMCGDCIEIAKQTMLSRSRGLSKEQAIELMRKTQEKYNDQPRLRRLPGPDMRPVRRLWRWILGR